MDVATFNFLIVFFILISLLPTYPMLKVFHILFHTCIIIYIILVLSYSISEVSVAPLILAEGLKSKIKKTDTEKNK